MVVSYETRICFSSPHMNFEGHGYDQVRGDSLSSASMVPSALFIRAQRAKLEERKSQKQSASEKLRELGEEPAVLFRDNTLSRKISA